MTERKGAWVLGALLVAGVHHLAVQDRSDPSSGSTQAVPSYSGLGLVVTHDASTLWPIGAMPSVMRNGASFAGDMTADGVPSFSSVAAASSGERGPSQGR